jgi:hypothetical protein
MTILVQRASDVRVQEIDLSQVITSASTAVGCQVVVSKQGSPDPKFFTTADDYLREYGNPDAQVSFDVYCGLDFFKEGDQLWARRAVHDDALYAGIVMYNNADDDTILKGTGGVEDPTIPDWSTLVPIPASDVPLALFYPIRGPGSYAKSLAIAVQSNNLSAPTGLAASSASTGGTLTTGTFQYQVSAVGENGETLASQAVQKQIVAGTTNTITLTWDPVPLANGYMIYGRSTTANLVGLMDTIGASSTTFTDTGLIPPDVTKKPITNPADLPAPDPTFTVSVFDLDQSVDNPVEQFVCTLAPHTDSSGIECELEERINP